MTFPVHITFQRALDVDPALIVYFLLERELLGDWACIQRTRARLTMEVVEVLLDQPAAAFAACFLGKLLLSVGAIVLDKHVLRCVVSIIVVARRWRVGALGLVIWEWDRVGLIEVQPPALLDAQFSRRNRIQHFACACLVAQVEALRVQILHTLVQGLLCLQRLDFCC